MNGKGKRFLSFVGAMKIARNLAVSGRHDEWRSPFPAPSLRELSSECETEGVYFDEWWNVKISEFRRGDENRPKPGILASTPMNGASHSRLPP